MRNILNDFQKHGNRYLANINPVNGIMTVPATFSLDKQEGLLIQIDQFFNSVLQNSLGKEKENFKLYLE